MKKEAIILEIKRIAAENGGIAPGKQKFSKVTGIKNSAWEGKHWRSWGDALKESGFSENKLNEAIDPKVLVLALIKLTRKIGRFPAEVDLRMEKVSDDTFPSHSTFGNRLGPQSARVEAVRKFIIDHGKDTDILTLLPHPKEAPEEPSTTENDDGRLEEGFVYLGLLKIDTRKRYKIGKTNLVERRSKEISLQLPEKLELIHYIRTDDMSGIESYWHRRFADKNTNGEWFDLSSSDIKAFRSRKSM